MKRILCILLMFLTLATPALADVDLSGMSFDELVALREQLNLAIWQSEEWQEVTVPQGIWKVGEDIPAGHWTITAAPKAYAVITVGDKLDDSGMGIDLWESKKDFAEILIGKESWAYENDSSRESLDVELENGFYIEIQNGSVVFTPYAGKPDLGFK